MVSVLHCHTISNRFLNVDNLCLPLVISQQGDSSGSGHASERQEREKTTSCPTILQKCSYGTVSARFVVNSDKEDNTVVMLWININSKLVWECHQSLVKLVEHNRIQLVWVPGHNGIDGNEKANQLARIGCSHTLKGPELAIGISTKVARVVIKD